MATQEEIVRLLNSLKNPRYATQGDTSNAPIAFDGELSGKTILWIANPKDVMDYGIEVWNNAKAGAYGPIGPYVPPSQTKQNVKPFQPQPGSIKTGIVVKKS